MLDEVNEILHKHYEEKERIERKEKILEDDEWPTLKCPKCGFKTQYSPHGTTARCFCGHVIE